MKWSLAPSLATLAVLVATGAHPAGGSGLARLRRHGGGDDVRTHGGCRLARSGSSRPSPTTAGIEVEAEVDSNRSGQVWHWTIKHNGSVSAKGARRRPARERLLRGGAPDGQPGRHATTSRSAPTRATGRCAVARSRSDPAAVHRPTDRPRARPGLPPRARLPGKECRVSRRRPWANPVVQFVVASLLLFGVTWWATGLFSQRAARNEAAGGRPGHHRAARALGGRARDPEGAGRRGPRRDRPVRPRGARPAPGRRRTPDQDLAGRTARSSTATRPS